MDPTVRDRIRGFQKEILTLAAQVAPGCGPTYLFDRPVPTELPEYPYDAALGLLSASSAYLDPRRHPEAAQGLVLCEVNTKYSMPQARNPNSRNNKNTRYGVHSHVTYRFRRGTLLFGAANKTARLVTPAMYAKRSPEEQKMIDEHASRCMYIKCVS